MRTGTIKTVVSSRGFGFVRDEEGAEHFFHISGCSSNFNALQAGDRVCFDLANDDRRGKMRAVNVAVM